MPWLCELVSRNLDSKVLHALSHKCLFDALFFQKNCHPPILQMSKWCDDFFFKKIPSFLKSIVGYLSLVIVPGHSFIAKLTW